MANSKPQVISIFDRNEGKVVDYKAFAARLPLFLERFPIEAGWRHERTVVEALGLVPHLHQLYLEAIKAGKNPRELGLPPLPQGFVFTSKLLNSKGEVVSSGSSTKVVADMTTPGMYASKEFEAAETAAFQRLLQAVGIGGDVFHDDEVSTIESMGNRVVEQKDEDGTTLGNEPGGVSPTRSTDAARLQHAERTQATVVSSAAEGLPDVGNPDAAFDSLFALNAADGDSAEEPVDEERLVPTTVRDDKAERSSETPVQSGNVVSINTQLSVASQMLPVIGKGRLASEKQQLAGLNRQLQVLARQVQKPFEPAETINDAQTKLAQLQQELLR
jgi:hypothetical protein